MFVADAGHQRLVSSSADMRPCGVMPSTTAGSTWGRLRKEIIATKAGPLGQGADGLLSKCFAELVRLSYAS